MSLPTPGSGPPTAEGILALIRALSLEEYHKRSNLESTFSAIKRKFGEFVRSKTATAVMNDVLAKILAHNVCCCFAACYELGIAPEFSKEEGKRDVLPMFRPG